MMPEGLRSRLVLLKLEAICRPSDVVVCDSSVTCSFQLLPVRPLESQVCVWHMFASLALSDMVWHLDRRRGSTLCATGDRALRARRRRRRRLRQRGPRGSRTRSCTAALTRSRYGPRGCLGPRVILRFRYGHTTHRYIATWVFPGYFPSTVIDMLVSTQVFSFSFAFAPLHLVCWCIFVVVAALRPAPSSTRTGALRSAMRGTRSRPREIRQPAGQRLASETPQ